IPITTWTVIIVDDDPDNLTIPKEMLTFLGAQVHTAENGVEGMELLATVKPTFMLLDLSMPKMDGWEMIKKIRANPETAGIPAIALTAHAMSGDKERVLEAGFNGYISKPFMLDTFLEEIQRCINHIKESPASC
ncbi:MAG: response regulator, partial [Chloroflexi bacterium]|nr:response regulator [Chloroflexota bacterium]